MKMKMKKLAPLFVFAAALFPATPALGVEGAEGMEGVEGQEVAYHGDVKGYLALPENIGEGESVPGVVLIHEWWGLNDDIRKKAREFADAGYAALAVDLYNGENAGGDRDRARELAGKARAEMDESFANLRSAFEMLRETPGVNSARLASVGWCFGGGWSYQIAKNDLGAKASVIYYGRFNPADDLSQMRAKIIGHFAEQDRGIKIDDVRVFQANLKTLSGDHEIFIYPNGGHGFANPDNPSYHMESAEQARARTLEFLERHL